MKGACCSHGRVSPALTHLAHPSRPLPFRSHCLSHTRAHKRFNVLVRSYTIRRAELADASALAEVDAACAPDGSAQWSAASFAADIDNPSATVLVAEVADTSALSLVGFGCARIVAGEAELQNMAILSTQRGQGLGKQILTALLEVLEPVLCAQKAGCLDATQDIVCHLEVRVDNAAAIALYQRCGFEEVGRRKRYYPDGTDALLMTRPAGPL